VYAVNSDNFLYGPDVMITTSNYKFNDGAPAFIREVEVLHYELSRVMRTRPASNTRSRTSIARTMSSVA
jgi:hypothetical protein